MAACQAWRDVVRLLAVKSPSPVPRRSVLLSFRFASVAVVGSLATALVGALGSPEAQLGMLGALVSILAGLFFSYVEQDEQREQRQTELLTQLSVPVALAADRELYDQYLGFCDALSRMAMQSDPILREIAALKASSMRQEITSLADGTVIFSGTETWRTVYEKLLASSDIKEYQSVAWARTQDYWQDAPGRQSLAVNFAALERGVLIERIVILRDDLWPLSDPIPTGPLGQWIEDQHNHGLWICLVRESQLAGEPDLLADLGIYGERACGAQELDDRSRTLRFVLQFDPEAIRLAQERWRRLELFATSYRQLLDRIPDD